jgi:hypothetical protein
MMEHLTFSAWLASPATRLTGIIMMRRSALAMVHQSVHYLTDPDQDESTYRDRLYVYRMASKALGLWYQILHEEMQDRAQERRRPLVPQDTPK